MTELVRALGQIGTQLGRDLLGHLRNDVGSPSINGRGLVSWFVLNWAVYE